MLAHELTHTQGPVSGFTRRVGDALVTVIGEVPPVTVRTVALSVTPADAARAGAPSAPASGEPDRPR
jgi:negative regulator of sigma E activity